MSNCQIKVAHLAALALLGGATAFAIPESAPVYTFCEEERNDSCEYPQYINAEDAIDEGSNPVRSARDCFYITGTLKEDCIWDIEPKCALRVYDKPQPARNASGNPIAGQFCEPILRSSDNFGWIRGVTPIDGAIRLGVAAFQDAFDGSINGLNNNARHGEFGEVTVKLYYGGFPETAGSRDAVEVRADDSYVFQFNGNDALRVSFIIPNDVQIVDIQCCDDTGTVGVCYDIDFYHIRGLTPLAPYAVQVVGGLTPGCDYTKTDTVVGIYNKQCFQIAFDDDGGQDPYSELVTYAEMDGTMVIAVSGKGDADFNGLLDSAQDSYQFFLKTLRIRGHVPPDTQFYPGSSTGHCECDDCGGDGDVIRYARSVWDNALYAAWFSPGNPPESRVDHGVCGGYTIKVSPAVNGSSHPGGGSVVDATRVDINGDHHINASDLALLLSFWGPVQR